MNILTSATYWVPFVWGLAMLAAWIGWGHLLRLTLCRHTRLDWGLLAGWGMSVTLALGGWLALFHLCTQTALLLLVLIGAAAWAITLYSQLRTRPSRARLLVTLRPRRSALFLPVVLLLLFLFATSLLNRDVNWWDDFPSYFVFAERLRQTGTIIDPFSWRRLSAYGGQQMFDATVLSGATFFNVDMLELGLAKIVFAGLLLGLTKCRTWRSRALAAAALIILLLVPVPRVNTQSQITGIVLFLTLLRTLRLTATARSPLPMALAAGLVGAAVGTLRMTFVPVAVLGIALAFLSRAALETPRWKRHLTSLLAAVAAFAAALLPWSLLLYQSSKSLFYPLMHGTERPEFTIVSAGLNTTQKFRLLLDFCAQPSMLLLLAPALLLLARRYRRTELPFYAAAAATAALIVLKFNSADLPDLYRYAFPALFAVVCALLVIGIQYQSSSLRRSAPAWVALILLATFHLPAGIRWLGQDRWALWSGDNSTSGLIAAAQFEPEYRQAQHALPSGKKFLSAVSFPNLFDFARNPIVSIDFPGSASPDPGMPLFQGAPALKAYLKQQGIEYLIFVDTRYDHAVFSRRIMLDTHTPLFDFARPLTLALLDDIDQLAASEEIVFQGKTLRTLHLK